jgi:hypothetical protein
MRGQWGAHIDLSTARTRQDNAPRQEMQPVLHAGQQLPILLGEIFGIADDGMTDAKKLKSRYPVMSASGTFRR